jgi:NADH-quinone oxidoreductase subunit J
MMTFELAAFWAFAAVTVLSAGMVITMKNPVHAVLSLILTFFSTACLWLLLQAEFLGIVLVLVYVGAVMVLFLFVVMMLDINLERLREGFWQYLPLGALVGVLMAFEMGTVLYGRWFGLVIPPKMQLANYSNTKELGRLIYTDYAFAFEIAAVVLLVAIVAAISLTLRRRKDSRSQDPSQQVRARREERVRLVSMPSEKDL